MDAAWQDARRDPLAFPDVAAQALQAHPPAERTSFEELARELMTTQPSVRLDRGYLGFSDVPLTLHAGDGFVVQGLVWLDGTTSIHDHGFSGAFTLLHGQSVQTHWSFDEERQVADALGVGRLVAERTEVLRPGPVQAIPSGPGFIHSVFHLAAPTVSIVVRTTPDIRQAAQRDYHPPGLSLASEASPGAPSARAELGGVLSKSGERWLEILLDSDPAALAADPADLLLLLQRVVQARSELGVVDDLLDATAEQLGPLRDLMAASLDETLRIGQLAALRADAPDDDERIFLAALLNARDRAGALELIGELRPGEDPQTLAIAWAQRLVPRAFEVQGGPETDLTCEVLLAGGDDDLLLRRAAEAGLEVGAALRTALILRSSLALSILLS